MITFFALRLRRGRASVCLPFRKDDSVPAFDHNPDASSASEKTTKHSNLVTIKDDSNAISSISYINGSLKITSGQPYDVPPSIVKLSGKFEITLQAGRSKTKGVADSFNSVCGGASKEYAPEGGGGTPDELNFMFGVVLHFHTGGSATVYLAQGSHGLTNNWWIGGSPVFSQDKPRLEYSYGNVYTFALSGNHETFNLKWTDTRPVSPIQNVFVLMMENHSFDNMLALSGIPGILAATTSDSNAYKNVSYYVRGNAPESMPTDPGHEFTDVVEQLGGTGAVYPPKGQYPPINNSGFAANYATTTTEGPTPPLTEIGDIMACFNTASQLPGMYQLAREFVVCDQWFSSLPGPTWPNRYFLHGASSNGLDHSPSTAEMSEWETVSGFRYPNGSIFDAMTKKDIAWRLYHDTSGPLEGSISQVASLHNIQMWNIHELSTFEKDVKSGSYPYKYTFIEPNYGDIVNGTYEGGSSQHPMDGVSNGEALIAKVYGSIRNSPLWDSSLLIIIYDEHGGFYDHYAPGPAKPPNDGGDSSKYNEYGFTFAQYGVRVPALMISPLLEKSVDHTIYDHSSVLKTLEWLFGLDSLTERDAAASVVQGVTSVKAPRKDCPTELKIPAPKAKKSLLTPEQRAARELEPIPDRTSLAGFLGVLMKTDAELAATPERRAAAVARFQSLRTRGDARAYIREVMARVRAEKIRRGIPTVIPA
jgi:phospholipase C